MRTALVLLVLVSLSPVTSAGTVERAAYLGQPVGIGCHGILQEGDCPQVENAGIQFGPFHARRMDVAIHDASSLRIGATYTLYDEAGIETGYGSFCSKATGIRIPKDTAYVVILIDMASSPKHCARSVGGTSGEVVARFA